ncbi:TPA: transcriptional regulator LrhA [Enterobacter hormaechei]|jgi:DNA-binding transcriptional LysR family regulator|uniref:Transcriptional regulator LrhA n=3 Tax=Enterobacter hormaechei TaxID=158836 RepID=A0AAE8X0K6_9ENTR|nr:MULTISPECIES: transcriptional regulator LrhA [Enterobacter]AVO84632.1 transcriptional regulator LrhA [Enterobacter cloacae complex sp.]EIM35060.1 DNA-binding transcriptional repressor LrhA [Enterobacter cloacae subsp. cloacae GS1]ELX7454859.1 transcriptional regulator LrhA [Enterobacter hormaechei subsp. hoffmannii]MBU5664277.1 transcriptional regulator LrhA [Enterobacteriaceae bacterium S32_ASV_15]MCM6051329.1 transcriptional regulator LrhA [Klebsiella pneumoniae]RYA73053.1 transcriptiona
MINANRPIMNLDLDLLRTFVAVADLNTFAAAAAAVCRTQSAVSQQMQRLEQLVGKELFARHGRNKLLTEHGIQLLGYARKILRFNDEACMSLMFSNLQGVLTLGASDESADTILPFLLNRISSVYPKLALDVSVKRNAFMVEMLTENEVDLVVTTHRPGQFDSLTLRTSPTHWYCAAEYVLQKGEPIPLVLLDDPSPFRDMVLAALNEASIPWRLAYVASTLPAVRAAVKAGLGVTARPVEMMSPDLRVLGQSEGLPSLPDTEYLLCHNAASNNELAKVVFEAMENYHNPWQYAAVTPEGGDDSLIVEGDFE